MKPVWVVALLPVLWLGNAFTQAPSDAFSQNRQLVRTINFGNALEAPSEGAWGLTLNTGYFDLVRRAGFSAIRLPVRWSAHALSTAPYTVESGFFERIDWAIQNATSRGLAIIVNMHHYDELFADPEANQARFLGIWQQIAARYKHQSAALLFEPINEPNAKLEPLWNDLLARVVKIIRQTNPTRAIVVGPTGWNNILRLSELRLPADPNLIVTVHSYEPFEFTHQGADWVNPSPPVGTVFPQSGSSLRVPWQNWSWDTSLKPFENGLEVRFQKGWAGLYLHRDDALSTVSRLRFTTDTDQRLAVACLERRPANGRFQTTTVNAKANQPVAVNCSSQVREVIVQNDTDSAGTGFVLRDLRLDTASGDSGLLSNQVQNLRELLDKASRWAKAHRVPLFVGEFGSYEKADLPSRVRYTKFMRENFEARGMSWAYWEFGSGFGIYDPLNHRWREALLNALIQQQK